MRAACFVLCFTLLLTACAGPRLMSDPFVYGNASDDGAPIEPHDHYLARGLI